MSRGPATFRQADLSRAIRAVIEATGVDVTRLRVRGDAAGFEITVRDADSEGTAGTKPGNGESAGPNEWDEVYDGNDQAPVRQ
jgi:hypothetical protein